MIKNQHGQGTVESFIVAGFLTIVVICFLVGCYLTFSAYWIKHQLHEAVICYSAIGKESFCREQTQKNIEKLLPKAADQRVQIWKQPRKVFAKYQLNVPFAALLNSQNQIQFEESLGL